MESSHLARKYNFRVENVALFSQSPSRTAVRANAAHVEASTQTPSCVLAAAADTKRGTTKRSLYQ
jgi:hypothetical protein